MKLNRMFYLNQLPLEYHLLQLKEDALLVISRIILM